MTKISGNKTIVYLAGGMQSDWAKRISDAIPEMEFFNPKLKEVGTVMSPDVYTAWDLLHIRKCDIVFAYLERTNPSGYGMSSEIGYAKALGKTIIFVSDVGHPSDKYFEFIRQCADVWYYGNPDLKEYIKTLRTFQ